VNADDELLMKLSTALQRTTYGSDRTEVQGGLKAVFPFLKLEWKHKQDTQFCETNLYGTYNFSNLMAAVAAGCFFEIQSENIKRALSAYIPRNNRSQQMNTGKNQLILDAYNANPVSLHAAIKSFVAYDPENPWLILGDMFELGDDSLKEHENIIRQIREAGFKNVLLIGRDFKQLEQTGHFLYFESTEQAALYLRDNPIENAYILLKGSRGMQLETLLKYL
jgi:UDP-N-acetylmuramoyl-tripeptide--D-alanyl-D-alanine ligase